MQHHLNTYLKNGLLQKYNRCIASVFLLSSIASPFIYAQDRFKQTARIKRPMLEIKVYKTKWDQDASGNPDYRHWKFRTDAQNNFIEVTPHAVTPHKKCKLQPIPSIQGSSFGSSTTAEDPFFSEPATFSTKSATPHLPLSLGLSENTGVELGNFHPYEESSNSNMQPPPSVKTHHLETAHEAAIEASTGWQSPQEASIEVSPKKAWPCPRLDCHKRFYHPFFAQLHHVLEHLIPEGILNEFKKYPCPLCPSDKTDNIMSILELLLHARDKHARFKFWPASATDVLVEPTTLFCAYCNTPQPTIDAWHAHVTQHHILLFPTDLDA